MVSLPTTEVLAALLDRALRSARVVDQRHGVSPSLVDMNIYRSLLRSFRTSYDPSARMHAYSLRPVVQDVEIEGQLTNVIKAQLREYIHDGHIQSAVYATVGGSTSGFKVGDLLGHWLDIAIARGPNYAANAFLIGLTDRDVQYQKITLIKGLRIDREVNVSDGDRTPFFGPPDVSPVCWSGFAGVRRRVVVVGGVSRTRRVRCCRAMSVAGFDCRRYRSSRR